MRKKPAYNQIKYPIWFIATFVAITELIVVLGLIKTSGIVQLLLTIFAISFPIFVVAVFFHFLLIKPDTLHLPSEYTAQ